MFCPIGVVQRTDILGDSKLVSLLFFAKSYKSQRLLSCVSVMVLLMWSIAIPVNAAAAFESVIIQVVC